MYMLAREIRSQLVGIVSRTRIAYYRFMGISIGKGCYVSLGAHLDVRRGRVTIGSNVSVSSGSYILGHTGFQALKEGQETALEDNVKIFVNAVVMPGVRVGKNSIVGAGAVVSRDVPPNALVMGNPARVVKRLEEQEA
jgi:acetyltransferase-like isoleucine patch superfamily enzyme